MNTQYDRRRPTLTGAILILLLAVASFLPWAADAAQGSAGDRQKVRIAYSSISGSMAPVCHWIAGFDRDTSPWSVLET